MAAAPAIVSLWKDKEATGFLCSGVLIAPQYVLTVAHAFTGLTLGDQSFICLLPGKHGAVPATLFARHDNLDAALFRLDESIGSERLRLPEDIGNHQGRTTTLHAIDPHSHHVATLNNHSIGCYDDRHLEYVLSPQSALGYSGGIVAVGGQAIALLNRRVQGEPIARAIALAKLRPWIACAIDTPRGGDDLTDADYDTLLGLLGERILRLLANDGTAALRRQWGFPRNAGDLAGRPLKERFQPLVVDLYQATDHCLDRWRDQGVPLPRHFKADCLALLGELLKLAIDRQDRSREELAEIAAATPERMFVACLRTGTAAAVYCSLADIPLRVAERKTGDRDIGGGSVIDLGGLAQGVGADAKRDAYAAAWLAVKREPVPADFGTEDDVDNFQNFIAMEIAEFDKAPWFLVAYGPREWLHGGGLANASDRLHIGLVIHSADSDYAYLACEERRLINLVCKYLQLLDTA